VPLRLVVRDPQRAPDLGAEVRQASYGDAGAMETALAGCETLFLVSAAEAEDRVAQHLVAVDTAAAAGVQRVVYLSFLNAAAEATFTLARQHFATEEHIRGSGMRHVFLRNSLYTDYVPLRIAEEGVIRGPAGTGWASWVPLLTGRPEQSLEDYLSLHPEDIQRLRVGPSAG
jgi:uncharacterized protein YbjT (DUF2867 family)